MLPIPAAHPRLVFLCMLKRMLSVLCCAAVGTLKQGAQLRPLPGEEGKQVYPVRLALTVNGCMHV
jgi:hypothetical protein